MLFILSHPFFPGSGKQDVNLLICPLLYLDWRRKWQPTPVLLPGKSHGLRILVGYSPWGRKELDMTERLHFTLYLDWGTVLCFNSYLFLEATPMTFLGYFS